MGREVYEGDPKQAFLKYIFTIKMLQN